MSEPRSLAILQPAYLPWLGYFELLDEVDVFVDYDDVQFTRRDWRTRNQVLGPNGPCWLRVPTVSRVGEVSSLRSPILAIELAQRSNWAAKHLRTLRQSYTKSRYFSDYFPALEEIYKSPPGSLLALDTRLRDLIASWLGITTPIYRASSLDVQGRKEERILSICRSLKADSYYSGAAARDYLHPELFRELGIELLFQEYQHPTYFQRAKLPFVPYLSTLDLLFNEGPASLAIIREGRCKRT